MAGRTAVRSASGGSLGALTPARLAAAAAAAAAGGGGGGGERAGGAGGGVAILQTERNHVVRDRRCSRSLAPRSSRCARAHTHTHARTRMHATAAGVLAGGAARTDVRDPHRPNDRRAALDGTARARRLCDRGRRTRAHCGARRRRGRRAPPQVRPDARSSGPRRTRTQTSEQTGLRGCRPDGLWPSVSRLGVRA